MGAKLLLRRLWLCVLLLILICFSSHSADLDIDSYSVFIKPDLDNHSLAITADISFYTSEKPLEIRLSALDKKIHEVSGAGVTSYRITDESLIVKFTPDREQIDSLQRISVDYTAMPQTGFVFKPDHIYTRFNTVNWLTSGWDLLDKVKMELKVALPASYEFVASGVEVGRELTRDTIIHHWRETRYRPLYTLGFAAGEFQRRTFNVGEQVFHVLSLSDVSEEINDVYAELPQVLNYLEQISGQSLGSVPYTYVMTRSNEMQEASGYSLVSQKYMLDVLREPRETWLMVHELAHEWWGNSITVRNWKDFWLHEGLVQFLVADYKLRFYGEDEYARELTFFRNASLRNYNKHGFVAAVAPRHSITLDEFKIKHRSAAYSKGAYLFHMLKLELGETVFWQGIKLFTQRYWESYVTTSNLIDALEEVSGKELAEFFNQWVHTEQKLELQVSLQTDNDVTWLLIQQQQDLTMEFPLSIQFNDGKDTLKRLQVNKSSQRVELGKIGRVNHLIIDAEGYLPIRHTLSLEPEILLNNLRASKNSFQMAMALQHLVAARHCLTSEKEVAQLKSAINLGKGQRIVNSVFKHWQEQCAEWLQK